MDVITKVDKLLSLFDYVCYYINQNILVLFQNVKIFTIQ